MVSFRPPFSSKEKVASGVRHMTSARKSRRQNSTEPPTKTNTEKCHDRQIASTSTPKGGARWTATTPTAMKKNTKSGYRGDYKGCVPLIVVCNS